MTRPLPFDRSHRLCILAVALRVRAQQLAEDSEHLRAMRALALSDAMHHAAHNDRIAKRLALLDARTYRRAARETAR